MLQKIIYYPQLKFVSYAQILIISFVIVNHGKTK